MRDVDIGLRLLGTLLADVENDKQDGLVEHAMKVALSERHLGPEGNRIWSAIKKLHRAKRPYDLRDIANEANNLPGDPVREEFLWDLAGPGSSQGPYLIREVVGRALFKDAVEQDGKLDIAEITRRLAVLDHQAKLPVMEDFGKLLEAEFPPIGWTVESMIVKPSLTFLAGRSKAGKSWLALQLAHCVATGQDFLGRSVEQGVVLYLALEDGRRRTQQRLKAQGWETLWGRAVIGAYDTLKLDKAGRNTLERMIQRVEPSLVVIDALAKVLPEGVKERELQRGHGQCFVSDIGPCKRERVYNPHSPPSR